MVIAKNQLFSEVPDFETPEWINLYKEPEEVIRTVGPNTFIIKPKNNKVYINGFLIPTKEWQRVIDGEEVEVTDDDGKTVTIVKRNDEIFFNEKPFTSETQPITTTLLKMKTLRSHVEVEHQEVRLVLNLVLMVKDQKILETPERTPMETILMETTLMVKNQ